MSGQALESQGQDASTKQHLVSVGNTSTNPELYVPTTTSSSSNTSLPETIDGTGVLTQATAVSAGVSDPSSSASFNSHNHLQQIQVRMCFVCPDEHCCSFLQKVKLEETKAVLVRLVSLFFR